MARSSAQSAQRYPLTLVLGNEANVRLLRELSLHGGQLSAPALVFRTGLAKTSVWSGLASLVGVGVVATAGTGRARLFSMDPAHALRESLDALFMTEERRFDDILEAVREAARGLHARSIGVWLYGSVARGDDRTGSDLDLAVVADADDLSHLLSAMRDALQDAGDRLGFVPAVVGIEVAELARRSGSDPFWDGVMRDGVKLYGHRPSPTPRAASAREVFG